MSAQSELDRELEKIAQDFRSSIPDREQYVIGEIDRTRQMISDMLANYAGTDGTISRAKLRRVLRELTKIQRSINDNGYAALQKVINDVTSGSLDSTNNAIDKVIGGAIAAAVLSKMAKSTAKTVINRKGDDGLKLSRRVWRLSADQKAELMKVLRADISKGESIDAMIRHVRSVYSTETWKIRRLVLTESAVAQRKAMGAYADNSDQVKALRIHHGRANVANHMCTILSRQDPYGWGDGVFKTSDTQIYFPHINCTSFLTYMLVEDGGVDA